jgi:hypothetical protein
MNSLARSLADILAVDRHAPLQARVVDSFLVRWTLARKVLVVV